MLVISQHRIPQSMHTRIYLSSSEKCQAGDCATMPLERAEMPTWGVAEEYSSRAFPGESQKAYGSTFHRAHDVLNSTCSGTEDIVSAHDVHHLEIRNRRMR